MGEELPLSFFRSYVDPGADLQSPFDVAVVMQSIVRPTIVDALASVFTQDIAGRVQVLIGVDWLGGDIALIDAACKRRPPHCCVNVFYPGYSTSALHGGVHPAMGGVLRTVLSYLANSRYVTYLDDDNWWSPKHLSSMRAAIDGAQRIGPLRCAGSCIMSRVARSASIRGNRSVRIAASINRPWADGSTRTA
jgi:hypothetical protein